MPPPPFPPPPPPPPVLTAVFSELPAENFGTVAAGMVTFWVGLRGLTPWRSLRCWVENFPKPVKLTSPPVRRTSVMDSSTASTASEASRLDRLPFCATLSTNSCFVTFAPLGDGAWRKTLAGLAFRLNHAVCGAFGRVEQLRRAKERPQTYSRARQRVAPALLAVDHADGRSDLQARLAQAFDRCDRRASGGDDVLDQARPPARFEDALEPVGRAVVLRLLAHDQERQPGGERRRGCERDRAELGAGEQLRPRLVLAHGLGDQLAQRGEQLRPGLEAVLVEVVA